MNFRNLVVSTIALAAVVGCSSSQGGDEKTGSANEALTCRTCDPSDPGNLPPPPAPKLLEGATCGGNPSCTNYGPFAFGSDTTKWTSFENSLGSLGCGQGNGYSVEMLRPDGTSWDWDRYTLCHTSTALTALIAANPGSTQAVYCDTCLGTPSYGYTWVSWDYVTTDPGSCPGGCGSKTSSTTALY